MAWMSLLYAVILPNIGGIANAFVIKNHVRDWYDKKIKKPSWRPPNKAFGPVWTLLYCMMGYASYRVWMELDEPNIMSLTTLPTPLKLFLLQLCLNWIWTPIFFVYKHLTLALFEILLLDGSVAMTMFAFWKEDALAGLLLIPYLAWLTLATALTTAIWISNPNWRFGPDSKKKK
ncbi:translocator protein-like [Scylla paramamosain]|uniref:translocator protein-like n=1 Tax=Scylla paramamosain TaxID=85552 RepID=UPI003083D3D8